MKHFDFEVRIAYADTDRMGVVYYGNYLTLFERGRTEFLRALGIRYRDLEDQRGIYFPAAESHIEYFAPAHYDDLIKVRTLINDLGGAHIVFGSEIYNEAGKLIARGRVKLVTVNRQWKPIRVPDDLKSAMESCLEK